MMAKAAFLVRFHRERTSHWRKFEVIASSSAAAADALPGWRVLWSPHPP